MTENQELPLMEAFYTIQGEGYWQGSAAYFIRLGGCDVGCTWCDVKESWDKTKHPLTSIEDIVKNASLHEARLAVITGGEPLMHSLEKLTQKLQEAGFRTNIETSGVCEKVSGNWDWICFSPKKFKTPNPAIFLRANELKIVVYHPSDLEWAESYAKKVSDTCNLYLQPEWSKAEIIVPLLVEYAKENPKWKISLQTHKFMNIP